MVRELAAPLLVWAALATPPAALASPAAAAPTLGALADAVASEVQRVSAGRPVELAPFEDRSGVGTIAADLEGLVRARLSGPPRAAEAAPRIAVTSVVAAIGTRLVWSGRAREEPSGRLVDVLSVSIPWDSALLALVPSAGPAGTDGVDVGARAATPPIEGRIVALAFAGDERLLVLFDDALALFRREGLALRLESRRDLPGPLGPVRFPGGLLLAAEGESACWAASSRSPRAVLFSLDGGRLTPTHEAEAMPWPGLPSGARFRPGTNLLEVTLPGVDSPVLAVDARERWVVAADGALSRIGSTERPGPRRAGPALTGLWPGVIAVGSGEAPGDHDRILLVGGPEGALVGTVAVDGAVRALAARRHGGGALLAAALEGPGAAFRILLVDVAERR